MYLTGAAPAQVKVEVKCKDFSDPATVTLPLAAHKSPVPEDAYRFPFAAGELRTDEYYVDRRRALGQRRREGTQIFAHDIGVVGWDSKARSGPACCPAATR